MSKFRLVGLTSIKYGEVNTTSYVMTTTLTTISNIVPGTAVLAMEMPTNTNYFTEDSDYPDIVVPEQGRKMIEWSTRDMQASNLTLALGGSAVSNTTAGTFVWSAPTASIGVVEKAIEAVSKTYSGKTFTFAIPVANLVGGGDLRFSNKGATEPGVLNFSAEVVMGEDANGDNVVPITATTS